MVLYVLDWPPKVMEKCPECSKEIVTRNFESFCKACGLIIEDQPFNDSVGFTNQKLSTFSVGGKNTFSTRAAKNVILADKKEVLFFELKRDLEKICDFLSLPSFVRKYSQELLLRVINEKLSCGRDFDLIVASIIYLSAKKHQENIDLISLSEFSVVNLKNLQKCIIQLNKQLNINLALNLSKTEIYLAELYIKKILDKDLLSQCFINADFIRNENVSERSKALCLAFIAKTKNNIDLAEEFCKALGIDEKHFFQVYHKINGELTLLKWQKPN